MNGVLLSAAVLLQRLVVATVPPGDPPGTLPDDLLGPVSQDPDDVRDTACRLVESQDVCQPPAPPATFEPSSSAFASLLGGLLWVLLIAVVLAVIYLGVRYFIDRHGSPSTAGDEPDDVDPDDDALVGPVIIDRSREPAGWRGEADEHRAAGRYRDALRCRYRALVGDLARRGLLDEIPARTTGEERRQLRGSAPNAAPAFRDAADLFDGAWYGRRVVGAGDDDRFRQLDHDVLASAQAMTHRIPRSYEARRHADESRSDEVPRV